jgi:hypothetical protein
LWLRSGEHLTSQRQRFKGRLARHVVDLPSKIPSMCWYVMVGLEMD